MSKKEVKVRANENAPGYIDRIYNPGDEFYVSFDVAKRGATWFDAVNPDDLVEPVVDDKKPLSKKAD